MKIPLCVCSRYELMKLSTKLLIDAQVAFDFLFDDGTVSQSPADGENDGQDGYGGQYGGVGQGRSVAVQMLGQVAFSREHQFAEGVECIFFDR